MLPLGMESMKPLAMSSLENLLKSSNIKRLLEEHQARDDETRRLKGRLTQMKSTQASQNKLYTRYIVKKQNPRIFISNTIEI